RNSADAARPRRRGDRVMRRREFITLLSSTAAWPLAVRAQQPAMPLVGILNAGSREVMRPQIIAFLKGLKESGYVEGQNLAVEYRFAEGQFDRFPALASDLIRRQVSLLFTSSLAGVHAAKEATSTIPIVFSVGDDPVALPAIYEWRDFAAAGGLMSYGTY